MTKEITVRKVQPYSSKELIFIGAIEGDEEYYQEKGEREGWSFMGLRPETEETLRERARETDPSDILGMSSRDFALIERYFDREQFENDMEEDWETSYDVQATREGEDGQTLYLGFGSGTSIEHYFKEHGITDYSSYCSHFDEIGLTEEEFNNLIK